MLQKDLKSRQDINTHFFIQSYASDKDYISKD